MEVPFQGRTICVCDTGVFIKLKDVRDDIVVTQSVLDEIRDEKSRLYMTLMDQAQITDIQIETGEPEDYERVKKFSMATGLYDALSSTDVDVAALAVRYTRMHLGEDHLNADLPVLKNIKVHKVIRNDWFGSKDWVTKDNINQWDDKAELVGLKSKPKSLLKNDIEEDNIEPQIKVENNETVKPTTVARTTEINITDGAKINDIDVNETPQVHIKPIYKPVSKNIRKEEISIRKDHKIPNMDLTIHEDLEKLLEDVPDVEEPSWGISFADKAKYVAANSRDVRNGINQRTVTKKFKGDNKIIVSPAELGVKEELHDNDSFFHSKPSYLGIDAINAADGDVGDIDIDSMIAEADSDDLSDREYLDAQDAQDIQFEDLPTKFTDENEDEPVNVVAMTTDYALQNVLLAIGVKLRSVETHLTIQNLRRFCKKCNACQTINVELNRLFCKSCGNNSLRKVEVIQGEDGNMYVNDRRKYVNKKGLNFSLPNPKTGKAGKFKDELVLCEDQLLTSTNQWRMRKQKNDRQKIIDSDVPFAGMASKKDAIPRVRIGFGHVHPNKRRNHKK